MGDRHAEAGTNQHGPAEPGRGPRWELVVEAVPIPRIVRKP